MVRVYSVRLKRSGRVKNVLRVIPVGGEHGSVLQFLTGNNHATQNDKAQTDPHLDQRTDILALLLRSTYEDGTPMSRQDVSDELLTLLGAGHETTASTLGWAFERLRRHPAVLTKLVEENDDGGNEAKAKENSTILIDELKVLSLFGYISRPSSVAGAKIAS